MHTKVLSEKEQAWILTQMKKYQIIEKSYLEAKLLIDEAITVMDAQGEQALTSIAKEMIERDF